MFFLAVSTSFLPFSFDRFQTGFYPFHSTGIALVKVSSDLHITKSALQFSVLLPDLSAGIDSQSLPPFCICGFQIPFIFGSSLASLPGLDYLLCWPSSTTISVLEAVGLRLQTSLSTVILPWAFGLFS